MRFQWFVCLLLTSIAFAQAAPPAPAASTGAKAEQAAPAADKAPEVKVGPTDTVLTVKGVCADSSKQGDDCKTAINKEQFEKLADALQPNMSPAIRRQLATAYSRMLLMSAAAGKRGLDKQPRFDEMLRFARMQILSQELSRALQEDAGKISDSDLEAYYTKNAPTYEEASLLRIFVPGNKQIATKPNMKDEEIEAQQKAGEVAMKKVAAGLHTRAVNGEDPDKLEKEAYVAAGLKGTPPNTKMEKVRRTTLPPAHAAVFELKPGQVSELVSDDSGHYIYKLLSKQTLPLDSVKQEIRNTLSAQRYRDSMQSFQAGNAELNDAYFGPAHNPAAPPAPHGGKPAQEGEVDPD
jgi:parvulin-like peptidyl-prolyl isomerase